MTELLPSIIHEDAGWDLMISMAKLAQEDAMAPKTGFKIGACTAHIDSNRSDEYWFWHRGFNIETDSYTAGVCAERVAVAGFLADYGIQPCRLVLAADAFVNPCGVCRQFLAGTCPPDMSIISVDVLNNKYYGYQLQNLIGMEFSKRGL